MSGGGVRGGGGGVLHTQTHTDRHTHTHAYLRPATLKMDAIPLYQVLRPSEELRLVAAKSVDLVPVGKGKAGWGGERGLGLAALGCLAAAAAVPEDERPCQAEYQLLIPTG